MNRMLLVFVLALLSLIHARFAHAQQMTSAAMMGATQVQSDDFSWRVWARRSDGHLMTVQRNNSPWTWTDRGTGGSSVGYDGVTATWWVDGAYRHERGYFVGFNGKLYELAIINNNAGTWTEIAAPTGKTFTGELTALPAVLGSDRWVIVFATMTNGDLYCYAKNVTQQWPWFLFMMDSGYATNRPLASTVDSTHTILSVFAVKSDYSIMLWRYAGSGFSSYNQGKPGTDINVCGSMSAAQGRIMAGPPPIYRVYLFCTKYGGSQEDKVRYLYGTTTLDTSFTWGSVTIPGGVSVLSTGNALAAIDRPYSASEKALDCYAIGNNDHVYLVSRNPSGVQVTDLGKLEETTDVKGGMTATREGNYYYSRGFFKGYLTNAIHLYSRAGAISTYPLWEALQTGAPVNQVSGTGTPHTESFMSEWRGKAIMASIVRSGPAPTDTYIQAAWSTNDGDTWGSQRDMEKNGYQYITDPTTAITDGGKAYVVMEGVNFQGGTCAGAVSGTAIYFVTTTDGVNFSTPTMIDSGNLSLDHPWVGIDRSRSPDRLHFVWSDKTNWQIKYRYLDDGGSFGPIRVLESDEFGPSTLSVGGDGSVYVSWRYGTVRVCKLNSDLNACQGEKKPLEDEWAMDGSDIHVGSHTIRGSGGWSIKASKVTPDKIYYAYQRKESDNSEKDVYLSVGTFNGSIWTFATPIFITTPINDDTDQFFPTIALGHDGSGFETLHVGWYDRRESCNGQTNFCIRAKKAYCSSSGSSCMYTQDLQTGDLTDPTLLPYHCIFPNEYFIGDYHDADGAPLHWHLNWSSAPIGSPEMTAILSEGYVSTGFYYY